MKRLMYVIPLSAVAVLLLAAPALTQTAPNHIEASPTQTTDAVQRTGGAATDPSTEPAETTAPAETTEPAPNSTTTVEMRNNAFNPARISSTLPRVRQSRSSIMILCRTLPLQTMDCSTLGS
jgi:hypothetical protein